MSYIFHTGFVSVEVFTKAKLQPYLEGISSEAESDIWIKHWIENS